MVQHDKLEGVGIFQNTRQNVKHGVNAFFYLWPLITCFLTNKRI